MSEKTNIDLLIEQEVQKTSNIWGVKQNFTQLNERIIEQIFNTAHEVNTLKDENNMPIPGTGRLITNEEKKMILEYMVKKKYPFTSKVYSIVLNGYINGEVTIENKETKGRKL